ncbi:Os09g0549700, partial [Oryza sativa Japonica Group]
SASERHDEDQKALRTRAAAAAAVAAAVLLVLLLSRNPSSLLPQYARIQPLCFVRSMSIAKRYVLRLFISLKYVTANVVDRQSGRVVVTASSVEKPLRDGLECGRTCNAKAAAAVGEVLAMRLKVDGLAREPIHADATKEVEKKGFKNRTKVWAILNALREHGVNLRLDDDGDHRPHV